MLALGFQPRQFQIHLGISRALLPEGVQLCQRLAGRSRGQQVRR